MKKNIFLLMLLSTVAATVVAQSLRKTEKINPNQVPAAILESFEKDFGQIPEEGYWTANILIEKEGVKSIVKPQSYTFHKKSKSEKIEVRYTPDGKLDFVKGLEKTNRNT